jgi:hypothetical protein
MKISLEKSNTDARIDRSIRAGAEMVRVGGRWMKVVTRRTGQDVSCFCSPVEFFSAQGRSFKFDATLVSLRPKESHSKFIHLAMTHTEWQPPVSYRMEQIFVDRRQAIVDFDTCLHTVEVRYYSAFIAFENWLISTDEGEIDFPIWRGVLEVPRTMNVKKVIGTSKNPLKLWAIDLMNLEEIEDASTSLLSNPESAILDGLEAPVRLVKV